MRTRSFESTTAPGSQIGRSFHAWPPVAIAGVVGLAGYLAITVVLIGLGLLVTRSSFAGAVWRWDESVSSWMAARRTASLNAWTDTGSILAGSGTILAAGAAAIGILCIRRFWYEAGFLAIALGIEITGFLTTTLLIDRPRPSVQSLDPLPVTSSFPSGHTAAAIVLYVGLAMIITSHTRGTVIRVLVWMACLLLPVAVGMSRIYRGLHHPTDVAASVVLGVGALLFAMFAVNAAAAAVDTRRRQPVGGRARFPVRADVPR
jgi:membrane-associated phospholipid phosphatase